MKLYLIPLLLLSILTPIFAQQDEAKKAAQSIPPSPIEGQWKAISGHEEITPMKAKKLASIFLYFKGENTLFTLDEAAASGKFSITPEENKILLSYTIGDAKVIIPVLYKLENDLLTICHFTDFQKKTTQYPTSFTPAEGLLVIKLKKMPAETRLDGLWDSIELWYKGNLLDDKTVFSFQESELRTSNGEEPSSDLVHYVTDSTMTPKRIRIYAKDSNLMVGIYKIEKDILHICTIGTATEGEAVDKDGHPKIFVPNKDTTYLKLKLKK